MASSIFGPQQQGNGGVFARVADAAKVTSAVLRAANGDPNAALQILMRNPKVASLMSQGKTMEQMAAEHGIDLNMLREYSKYIQ